MKLLTNIYADLVQTYELPIGSSFAKIDKKFGQSTKCIKILRKHQSKTLQKSGSEKASLQWNLNPKYKESINFSYQYDTGRVSL